MNQHTFNQFDALIILMMLEYLLHKVEKLAKA